MRVPFAILVLAAACHAPAAPAGPTSARSGVVVLISATAEWTAVRARFPAARVEHAPPGEWFTTALPGGPATFLHGGWGKVAAASSTQYAIDHFHPALLVNLGTAGGFAGQAAAGDVILASKTVIYDIVERMGDPAEAIAEYATPLATAAWPDRLRGRVRVAPLASADGDLDPAAVADLATRFHAVAGDWESGAIAWVSARNGTPVVILRGVSDVVTPAGSPTYGSTQTWQAVALATMTRLLDLFIEAQPDLLRDARRYLPPRS